MPMPQQQAAKSGLSIVFPDVCKMPAPPAPAAPIPYPNIAKTAQAAQKQKTASKAVASKATAMASSRGDAPGVQKGIASANAEINQLKALLNQLHSKLQVLGANNPDEWQKVLQDYAVAAGALYVTKVKVEGAKVARTTSPFLSNSR